MLELLQTLVSSLKDVFMLGLTIALTNSIKGLLIQLKNGQYEFKISFKKSGSQQQ